MEKAKDYLMTALLLALCLCVPKAYLTSTSDCGDILTFHFTHANAWHLLANTLFLLRFKPRWRSTLFSWLAASLAAFLPLCACSLPTCGLSGVCYAMAARSNAYRHKPDWWLLGANIPMAFIGVLNWRLHIISYIISYTAWTLYLRTTNH